MASAVDTKPKKRRARRKTPLGAGRKLPESVEEFEERHRTFIRMRSEGRQHKEIAEVVGVDDNTITRWFQHAPFRQQIMNRWAEEGKMAGTLSSALRVRVLLEIERRVTSDPSGIEMRDLVSALRALQGEGIDLNINLGVDLGKLDRRGLADLCRRESEEVKSLEEILDPEGSVGSRIAQFSRAGAVPATNSPET